MKAGVEAPSGNRPAADPRRRHGGHGQARQLLADDGRSLEPVNHAWRGLVSALQRHTVEAALAALHEEERFVLSLAYLEGRTNREIAAMLEVSVSTVGRRLTSALARLEQQLTRAGAVVSAGLLLAVAFLGRRLAVARAAKLLAPSTSHGLVMLTAASAAGAIAVGLVVVSTPPATVSQRPAPVVHAFRPAGPVADNLSSLAPTPAAPVRVADFRPAKPADPRIEQEHRRRGGAAETTRVWRQTDERSAGHAGGKAFRRGSGDPPHGGRLRPARSAVNSVRTAPSLLCGREPGPDRPTRAAI